jgi:hypothetical protein
MQRIFLLPQSSHPPAAEKIVTVYRGMTRAEYDKLVETLTLESKAMRTGLDTPPSAVRAS